MGGPQRGVQSPPPQPPAPLSGGRPHPNKAACAGSLGTESASSGSARRRPGRARPRAPLRAEGSGAPQGGRAGGREGTSGLGSARWEEPGSKARSGRRAGARPRSLSARAARASPWAPGGRRVVGTSRHPGRGPSAGDDARRSCTGRERADARERAGRRNRWLPWGQTEVGAVPGMRPGAGEPGWGPRAFTALKLGRAEPPPSLRGRGEAAGAARWAAAERPRALEGGGMRGGRAEAATGGAVDAVESVGACVS